MRDTNRCEVKNLRSTTRSRRTVLTVIMDESLTLFPLLNRLLFDLPPFSIFIKNRMEIPVLESGGFLYLYWDSRDDGRTNRPDITGTIPWAPLFLGVSLHFAAVHSCGPPSTLLLYSSSSVTYSHDFV